MLFSKSIKEMKNLGHKRREQLGVKLENFMNNENFIKDRDKNRLSKSQKFRLNFMRDLINEFNLDSKFINQYDSTYHDIAFKQDWLKLRETEKDETLFGCINVSKRSGLNWDSMDRYGNKVLKFYRKSSRNLTDFITGSTYNNSESIDAVKKYESLCSSGSHNTISTHQFLNSEEDILLNNENYCNSCIPFFSNSPMDLNTNENINYQNSNSNTEERERLPSCSIQ